MVVTPGIGKIHFGARRATLDLLDLRELAVAIAAGVAVVGRPIGLGRDDAVAVAIGLAQQADLFVVGAELQVDHAFGEDLTLERLAIGGLDGAARGGNRLRARDVVLRPESRLQQPRRQTRQKWLRSTGSAFLKRYRTMQAGGCVRLVPNQMRVGVFTPLLSQLPLPEVLKKLKANGIGTVELGTGNYPGDAHCKLSMLKDRTALETFKKTIADEGFSISALSCHGNPLHPDRDVAKSHQETSRKTILLAEKLGVPVVVDFSGCPGDSRNAKRPNWVTCPWPPEYLETLKWQWDEVVAPYWTKHAQVRGRSRREDRHRDASGLCGLQSRRRC